MPYRIRAIPLPGNNYSSGPHYVKRNGKEIAILKEPHLLFKTQRGAELWIKHTDWPLFNLKAEKCAWTGWGIKARLEAV